ncbi:hypothetical protein BD410DRAFT_837200 [Rickenella mellea]|uniref:C2H2-type domain-containing protein n=1 Tax=Rickenella mellea TaxID=50990 RepID=A0A4Y7QDG4_9AGAM|nr:hypothetical protein BD410DRAFT_837200 [Rickenella mellea]
MATTTSPLPIHPRSPSQHSPLHFSPTNVSRSISSVVMSWTEYSEFPSRSPMTSSLHVPFGSSPMSMSCSPGYDVGAERIPKLERDFCSNFSCCGQSLADLHELLCHFEEAHVIVVGADGRPLSSNHSSPCSSVDLPSGPRTPPDQNSSQGHLEGSSSVHIGTSPPQSAFAMTSVLKPADLHTFLARDNRRVTVTTPKVANWKDDDDIMMDFDPLDHAPSPTHSMDTPSHEPVCLPPALLNCSTVDQLRTTEAPRTVSRHGSSSKLKGKVLGDESNPTTSRKREKAYKCPKNGCTKSYLNPNGLKYHLSKGTCSIISAEDD